MVLSSGMVITLIILDASLNVDTVNKTIKDVIVRGRGESDDLDTRKSRWEGLLSCPLTSLKALLYTTESL
jgi:hypothetical protein